MAEKDPGLDPTLKTRAGEGAELEIRAQPLPPDHRFILRGIEGPTRGREFVLDTAQQLVGRSDAQVNLDDPSVSRKHAVIEIFSPDMIHLRDLASTNGTRRNGDPIQLARLKSGDTIHFGDCGFEFRVEKIA